MLRLPKLASSSWPRLDASMTVAVGAALASWSCGADVEINLLQPGAALEAEAEPGASTDASVPPTPGSSGTQETEDEPTPTAEPVEETTTDVIPSDPGVVGSDELQPAETPDAGVITPVDVEPEAGVAPDAPSAVVRESVLLHHYDFNGMGVEVMDRVGSAHGVLVGGAELDGSGAAELDGVDDYVDLPNGIISAHEAVSLAAWLVWRGGPCWQRVFDFGSSVDGEDVVSQATTSLYLTPASCGQNHVTSVTTGVVTAMFHVGGNSANMQSEMGLPVDLDTHVVFVAAPEGGLTMYVDGALVASNELVAPNVQQINDVNNWLGRSQWVQDATLDASFDDFRIYSGELSGEQVLELYERGPEL